MLGRACTRVKPNLNSRGHPVFPQQEAAYPPELCHKHALAALATAACQERGARFPTSAFCLQGALAERSAPTKQGLRALPPLVSEYALVTDQHPNHQLFKQLTKMPSFVEKGEYKPHMHKKARTHDPKMTEIAILQKDPTKIFGVFREPQVFVQASLTARHPIDYAFPLPDALLEAIAKLISDGPKLTEVRRKLALKKLQTRAIKLAGQESVLHSKLDPKIARVVEGKNLLLWKELLDETSYDDAGLFDEFWQGFKVTGPATHSNEFPWVPAIPSLS